jgi:flagellar hook-associated protein 3 FlgL
MIGRVSLLSFSRHLARDAGEASRRLLEAQEVLSSGKRIHRLSDDPTGAVRALDLAGMEKALAQQERNLSYARPALEQSDAALAEVGEILVRARELALAMASDTYTAADRRLAAVEARQLYLRLLALSNMELQGRYLFAGHRNGSAPFVEQNGRAVYRGGPQEIEIGLGEGEKLAVNLPGQRLFQGAGVPGGVPLHDLLLDLEAVLQGAAVARSLALAVHLDSGIVPGSGFSAPDAAGSSAPAASWQAEADFIAEVTVFDSGGSGHALRLLFAKTAADRFAYRVVADGAEIQGGTAGEWVQLGLEGELVFAADGSLDETASTVTGIALANLASGADDIVFDAAAVRFSGSTHAPEPSAVTALNESNTASLSAELGRLNAALEQVLALRAELGSRLNRLDAASEAVGALKLHTTVLRSSIEDADLIQAIADFQRLQTALTATLQAGARMALPSLLDFLR